MRKKKPSNMTLYGIAAGFVLFGGTIVSMKSTLFPEPLLSCSQRYGGGLDFPAQQAKAQPVSIRDVQTKLGYDEWGLVENVSLAPLTSGPYAVALNVVLAKGMSGDKNATHKGGVSYIWKPGIQGGATSVCLSYAVRPADTFEFHEGGTLPGVFGGEEPRGGVAGFAARMAWRHNGSGDVLLNAPATGERGALLTNGAWRLPKGAWTNIEQEVRLNSPGRADGFLAIWIDGVLRVELKQVMFRARDAVRIEGVVSDVHYNTPAPSDTSLKITNFNLRWR